MIITLITIPSFILAAAFGTLGTAMLYLGSFINIMFSTEGMNKLFGNSTEVEILDTCMNKDGNLKPIILGKNTNADLATQLDKFILNSNKIKDKSKPIFSDQAPPSITYYTDFYTQLEVDVGMDPSESTDAPLNVLRAFTKLTDADYPESDQAKCSSNTYDFWYSKQNTCPEGYANATPSSSGTLGKPSCLKLNEWKEADIQARYATQPVCDAFVFVAQANAFGASLNQYQTEAAKSIIKIQDYLVQ